MDWLFLGDFANLPVRVYEALQKAEEALSDLGHLLIQEVFRIVKQQLLAGLRVINALVVHGFIGIQRQS